MTGRGKLVGASALVGLLLVAVAGFGLYFLLDKAPRLVNAQRAEVARQYRAVAEEMSALPPEAFARLERRARVEGWRQRGRIGERWAWGVAPVADGRFVWLRDRTAKGDEKLAGRVVPAIDAGHDALWLYGGVIALLALLFAGVVCGVAIFYRYARVREDFMRAVAHDLKTPLAALQLTVGTSVEDERVLVKRMIGIVRNVSDFLALGGKRPAPQCEPVSLAAAWREAYAVFAEDFELKESGPVTFSGDATVRADPTLLVQILWNLIGNELKYAASHGPIAARVTEKGVVAELTVTDAGPGMTARERRHAFDRYYRAKTVLKSGAGGFGIGLCTAREHARAMGGDLSAAASGRGSALTLSLPRDCA